MTNAGWGAVAAVAALAVAFWVGRLTVPDRSAELIQWREVAESVGREAAAAEARADSAARRATAIEARADTAAQRARAAAATADRRGAAIVTLRDSLATLRTASDSVPVLVAVVAQQDTVIRDLRAGVRDAADALAGLHADLALVRDDLTAERRESARLRGIIAAGLEATKPSRGRALGFLDCTVGVGATSQGLDYRSATCGVSVRGLIGGR